MWITNVQTKIGENPSIKKPFIGPYQIVQLINDNNYKIKRLNNKNSVPKIINCRRMKKYFMRPEYLNTNEQNEINQRELQSTSEIKTAVESNSVESDNVHNEKPNTDIHEIPSQITIIDSESPATRNTSTLNENSEDSLNNNFYELKNKRPQRTLRKPDYYNSVNFKNKTTKLLKINHKSKNLSKTNSPNDSDSSESQNINESRKYILRKKKPPDKL